MEATLYDITGDFSHQYLKMFFQVNEIDGKTARTLFRGHEYSRDYLRSLVRRRTTKVDGLFNLTTKDGFKMRVAVSALNLSRIKTSQEKIIRKIMEKTIKEKAAALTLDGFVQEVVLGKIASDIYNESKKVAPLRHVGIRKSKLIGQPAEIPKKGQHPQLLKKHPRKPKKTQRKKKPKLKRKPNALRLLLDFQLSCNTTISLILETSLEGE